MKEIKITIPEDVVNDIQVKDFTYNAAKDVIAGLIESHSVDLDDRIIGSPVFVGYQQKMIDAKTEFEKSKDDMINQFVKDDIKDSIVNWNLNYSQCMLILTVK